MWTHICMPSQGNDSILPCVVTRMSAKVAKHIQIRILVGRSIQAKAASNRHRRSLRFWSEMLCATPKFEHQLCLLIHVFWLNVCAQTVLVNFIVFFWVYRPVPRPETQRDYRQGSLDAVGKRARGTKPLPGTADCKSKL